MCTPSLLERRKSIKVEDDDDDDDEEIVIKPVPENFDDIEDSEEDSDECEEEDAP